jgi:beta-lactamase regulating signal transducer with metallopeptidase domain
MSFDFLVEMAWKSALISGSALALAELLRRRSASERAALLATAVALIVALPLATLLLPALPVVTSTVHEAALPILSPAQLAALAAAAPATAPAPTVLDDPAPLLELLWAGGAAAFLARLLAGLATLRRWTAAGSEIACPAWRRALERAAEDSGCRRPVRLLVADVPSPMSWGAFRPVILIDPDTARDPNGADAVVAHEMAHIVRGDWAVLILSRLAVAGFWFNPLMWLLERRIRGEAEEAADARALEHVEPELYARTLLSCAQSQAGFELPASAMADTSLRRRVKAILERRLGAGAPKPRWVSAAVLLAALVAAPIAALKPVQAIVRAAPAAPAAPPAPKAVAQPAAAPRAPVAPPSLAAAHSPAAAPAAPTLLAMAEDGDHSTPPAPPAPPVPPVPPAPLAPPPPIDGAAIAREVEAAVAASGEVREQALREGERARAEAMRAAGRAQGEAMHRAQEAAAHVQEAVRMGMTRGADGMVRGADGMERGARKMEEEADRLGSPAYRQQRIAEAARQGRTVTDRQLIDAIPQLREGAKGMREGAAGMRREAERMRRGEG